jgi:hypothetical protein
VCASVLIPRHPTVVAVGAAGWQVQQANNNNTNGSACQAPGWRQASVALPDVLDAAAGLNKDTWQGGALCELTRAHRDVWGKNSSRH